MTTLRNIEILRNRHRLDKVKKIATAFQCRVLLGQQYYFPSRIYFKYKKLFLEYSTFTIISRCVCTLI